MKSLEQIRRDETEEHIIWLGSKHITPLALMSGDERFEPSTWQVVMKRQPKKTKLAVLALLKQNVELYQKRIAFIEGLVAEPEGQ